MDKSGVFSSPLSLFLHPSLCQSDCLYLPTSSTFNICLENISRISLATGEYIYRLGDASETKRKPKPTIKIQKNEPKNREKVRTEEGQ